MARTHSRSEWKVKLINRNPATHAWPVQSKCSKVRPSSIGILKYSLPGDPWFEECFLEDLKDSSEDLGEGEKQKWGFCRVVGAENLCFLVLLREDS